MLQLEIIRADGTPQVLEATRVLVRDLNTQNPVSVVSMSPGDPAIYLASVLDVADLSRTLDMLRIPHTTLSTIPLAAEFSG